MPPVTATHTSAPYRRRPRWRSRPPALQPGGCCLLRSRSPRSPAKMFSPQQSIWPVDTSAHDSAATCCDLGGVRHPVHSNRDVAVFFAPVPELPSFDYCPSSRYGRWTKAHKSGSARRDLDRVQLSPALRPGCCCLLCFHYFHYRAAQLRRCPSSRHGRSTAQHTSGGCPQRPESH